MSENVGASTSRNPKGLHGLYGDNFTLQTSLCNTIKNYIGKQTGTVNGLKRKIHKNVAEFYLPKNVLAKNQNINLEAKKHLLWSTAVEQLSFMTATNFKVAGRAEVKSQEKGGRHKERCSEAKMVNDVRLSSNTSFKT
jgi:hypothetical protein